MKILWLLISMVLLSTKCFAAVDADHPRVWLTPAYLAELKQRAITDNTTEWQDLVEFCNDNINEPGYDVGDFTWEGFRGSGYRIHAVSYALAYLMLKDEGPAYSVTANTYANRAIDIMEGVATGFALGSDPSYGVSCLRSGETTDGTVNIDAGAAMGINVHSYKPTYNCRTFGIGVPVVYDWLYSRWSVTQKTIFTSMMYSWVDWVRGTRSVYNNGISHNGVRYFEDPIDGVDPLGENSNINSNGVGLSWDSPVHNFGVGANAMCAMVAYATYGDTGNTTEGSVYMNVWHDRWNNLWKPAFETNYDLKGGDSPEGWNYMSGHPRIIQALRAMYTATDQNPFITGNCTILKDFWLAYTHHTYPNLTDLCDHGSWTGDKKGVVNEGSYVKWQPLLEEIYPGEPYHEWAQYYINNSVSAYEARDWIMFFNYDPEATATYWDSEPLYHRSIGTGLVTMRSSWENEVDTVFATAQLDNMEHTGHEDDDEGQFQITRGSDKLIVDGSGGGTTNATTIMFGGNGQQAFNFDGMIAIEGLENDDSDYLYVWADIKGAYHREFRDPYADQYIREIAYIRPNVFVVYDDASTGIATSDDKLWMINFLNEPALDGNTMTSDVGNSRVFVKTLIPETIGATNLSYGDTWKGESWKVEISPNTVQNRDTFLHAIVVMDVNTVTPDTIKIDSALGGMVGVHIDAAINYVVMFNEASGNVVSTIQYTVTPTNDCKHYIFDVTPNTVFDVSTAPGSTIVTITPDGGGLYTSSAYGVLTFQTSGLGAGSGSAKTILEGVTLEGCTID